jgi:hypothetical protein
VVGILNGVDYDEWSPERDRHLPARYSASDRRGKELCKQALLESLGLPYVPGGAGGRHRLAAGRAEGLSTWSARSRRRS